MNTATKPKYPVAQFELIPASKNGANFVREDTIGTPNPVVIIHPKNRVIQNTSVIKEESKTEKDVFVNVPTRYVYGQQIIRVDKQAESNIQPNPKTDSIVFINGLLTVPKDGPFVGLYNFMTTHAQNDSNPDKIESLKPVFREIKLAEDAHKNNFTDFQVVEAVGYIKALVPEVNGKFVYNEERIEALATLFNVYAETMEQKTTALIAIAKTNPQNFLSKAKANEQTVLIEVQHGLKLGVISFEGNTAIYAEKKTKIKEFPGVKSDDKKNEALANYFSTIDGKEAYALYKAELTAAKEANLSKQ
jgi:hypothetical protein